MKGAQEDKGVDRQRGHTEEELREPETWDFEQARVVSPQQRAGAVVSVRFTADEFDVVDAAAGRAKERLSTFIRIAASRRARGTGVPTSATGTAEAGWDITRLLPTTETVFYVPNGTLVVQSSAQPHLFT